MDKVVSEDRYAELAETVKAAWEAREKAYPWKSETKVGCAILSDKNEIFVGWNIEGRWQTSIHAEVSAIIRLAGGKQKAKLIVIVSHCKNFTPCGACLDWLFQFSTPTTSVVVGDKDKRLKTYMLRELCLHYPVQ